MESGINTEPSINIKSSIAAEHIAQSLQSGDWSIREVDGLTLAHSPLLSVQPGLVHAFTTRHGGDTPAPFDSFNLGRSVGDESVKVKALENRRRLCQVLGINHDNLQVPGQVHSGNVVLVEHPDKPSRAASPELSGVDGLYTSCRQLPLLLHFADCVPVLVYEKNLKLLSIVHAGWRGTAQGIAATAVDRLLSKGGNVQDMVAAVGPAIGPCCYPTGDDVVEKLIATLPQPYHQGALEALVEVKEDGQKRPNLKAFNALQLLAKGLAAQSVDVSSYCTCCMPEIFFSHRQSGGTTGRQGAVGCMI